MKLPFLINLGLMVLFLLKSPESHFNFQKTFFLLAAHPELPPGKTHDNGRWEIGCRPFCFDCSG